MAARSPFSHSDDWGVVRLGEIATKIGSGATPTGGEDSYQSARTRFALVRSQNVFDRHFDSAGLAFISDEQASRLRGAELQPGDLLLNITGDGVTFSRACAVPAEVLPACVNQHVAIIRFDKAVADAGYVLSYLTHPAVKSYIESFNAGGSRRAITKAHIESFEIPLPPIGEQRAIAHILGTLDDKIELNLRMNETLEAMARALFKSWFVDFDPVRAKAEGRDPGLPQPFADLFPDSFEDSELGEIPKGWDVKPLSDCVDVARGLSYKGSGLSESGVPMHNLNSIYEGGGYKDGGLKHYDGDYKSQHVARVGDLIVANTEQGHDRLLIGYAAIVPARFGQGSLFSHHLYRVRPKHDSKLTAEYLCHLLNTNVMHDIVSGYANGTTVNMLPIDGLQSPVIIVPDARAIATFDGVAERARMRNGEMIEESRNLAALRDAVLPKLISGELRVEDAGRVIGRMTA